jgi:hypothetical protein
MSARDSHDLSTSAAAFPRMLARVSIKLLSDDDFACGTRYVGSFKSLAAILAYAQKRNPASIFNDPELSFWHGMTVRPHGA